MTGTKAGGQRSQTYHFHPVAACEMCGAANDRFELLGLRLNTSQGMRPKRASGLATSVKRCPDCGLIFADPQPRPADFADHYGEAEDYWNDDYFAADETYFVEPIA